MGRAPYFEWDPQARHEGEHYYDELGIAAVKHVAPGLTDILDDIKETMTSAGPSVEKRDKSYNDNIRYNPTLDWEPTSHISNDTLFDCLEATFIAFFNTDKLRLTPVKEVKYPNGLAGWGLTGHKHDPGNFTKALFRLLKFLAY